MFSLALSLFSSVVMLILNLINVIFLHGQRKKKKNKDDHLTKKSTSPIIHMHEDVSDRVSQLQGCSLKI